MLRHPRTHDIVRAPVDPAPASLAGYGLYEPRPRRRRIARTIEIVITFALGMAAIHYGAPIAIAIFVAIAEELR